MVFLALLRILFMGLTTGAHGGQSVSCDLF
jgi:hypothetical protein